MILLLFLLIPSCLAITADQCNAPVVGDELEYNCPIGDSTITFRTRLNEYVRVYCDGPNITCPEIPHFNFGFDLPLKSLSLDSCPARVLRCIKEVVTASSLEVVVLDNLTQPLEKEDVEQLGEIRVLIMVNAAAQKSLPIEAIQAIPTLKHLRIVGGDIQVSPDTFQRGGTPSALTYLELAMDNITVLPAGGFRGLGNLNELNIWGNSIEKVGDGAFIGLDSLQKLALSTNNIKYIDNGIFADTPHLRRVVMLKNDLEIIPNGLFKHLDMLENVTIQYNKIPLKLDTHTFTQLPSLKNVIIQYSRVRTLYPEMFNGTTSLQSLVLNSNNIEELPEKIFLPLNSLKRLDLSHNKIRYLPGGIFAGLKNLEYLNMDKNAIQVLSGPLFSGLTQIQEIYINNNNITTIDFVTFTGAPNLHTLGLSNNMLTFEPLNQYINMMTISPLSPLKSLRKLYLSGNEIRSIFDDWRNVMLNLEYLDLSYNQFEDFYFAEYQNFLSKNLTIDIRHNNISHVTVEPPFSLDSNLPEPTLTTYLFDHNPIICDCYIYTFRLRTNGVRYTSNELKFVLDDTRCASPFELQGKLIKNIPLESLTCELQTKPENCTSTIARVATNELILNCPKLPKVLPDVNSDGVAMYFVKMPTITLNLDYQPTDLNGLNIHTLNLSYIGIEELIFKPTKSLKILDISNNYLKFLPKEFLNNNITIYLSNNPLECDCWHSESIAAIQKYEFIADFEKVSCVTGDKIAQIDAASLCNTWKASIAALGTFLTLGIVVLCAALVTYRYSHEILVYITSRGLCSWCVSEVMLDKDKTYDVFISFAHQDFDIVQKLVLKLESEYNQKVCVHYRDWLVGDLIQTQILRSVESSRKTVIILSKNFLESMWANLEFSAAHNLALADGKARVILILLDENVAKHDNLSEEIKAYISTNTYLLYDDTKFWEKLYKVLPKVEHKFTMLEFLKKTGNTGSKTSNGLDVQLNSEGKLINMGNKDKTNIINLSQELV